MVNLNQFKLIKFIKNQLTIFEFKIIKAKFDKFEMIDSYKIVVYILRQFMQLSQTKLNVKQEKFLNTLFSIQVI